MTDGDRELELLRGAVVRLRARVMAISLAMLGGTGLSFATLWLLIRGGPNTGQHLALLSNYFPGYAVTWWGVGVGFFYGALTGVVVGWALASIYNRVADPRRIL